MRKQSLLDSKHSPKVMWGCGALVLFTLIVALTVNTGFLVFLIPCMLMMGAMMWLMMGGRNSRM